MKGLSRFLGGLLVAAMLAAPLSGVAAAARGSKTDTTLALSTAAMPEGEVVALTLTATVTVAGGEQATGELLFKVGGTHIALVPIATVDGAQVATATYDASGLPAGEHVFHAMYQGQGDLNASNAIAKLTVSARPTPPTAPTPPSDTTGPVIVATIAGTQGANGWYTSDVTLSWSVTDGESAVVSQIGCDVTAITEDTAGTTLTCTAASAGGTSTTSVTVKRDATIPAVTFAGATDYTVDRTVDIACSAIDATSGIASAVCPGAQGAAYLFNVGANTLSASAMDNAGNAATASYAFTVRVTADALCNLTKRFATKPLGDSLCAQLNAAAAAAARGNAKASANALGAYTREVSAQTGKAFTPEKAAILIRLAGAL